MNYSTAQSVMEGNKSCKNIEEVYNRWQRQPQDEIEQREMECEMRDAEVRDSENESGGGGFHGAEENTLGEWSDGDDDWIWDVNENTSWEWSDSDGDWIWDVKENVQTGRGKKRKSTNADEGISTSTLPEENFYVIENVKQVKSKKFRTTAVNYSVRFNNTENDLDLIESYERTQGIFEHLLDDRTSGMNEKDQVRFVFRSTQLDTPISLPFMAVLQLTPERVFSQIERVIQSNRDFRLNDTVVVDIVHVEAPQGSGKRKRGHIDIAEFLHKKRSVVTIQNKDDLCLARALVVAIAKIEKDPMYKSLRDPEKTVQGKKARELHELANVPLGPCGIPEVKMFQKHLTDYEMNSFCRTQQQYYTPTQTYNFQC